MTNGTVPLAVNAKASTRAMVLSNARSAQAPRTGEVKMQVDRTSAGAIRLDNLMSTTGDGGTEDQTLDPNEQTETRTRSPMASVDSAWDLDVPVATKVPSVAPKALNETVSNKTVNPSKFPSAMAELRKSEPALLDTDELLVVKRPPVTQAVRVDAPRPSVAPVVAVKNDVTVGVRPAEALVVAPIVALVDVGATSESKFETVKESPSVKLIVARPPQESLLSLESAYVVDFFSSAPPARVVDSKPAFDHEIEQPIAALTSLAPEQLMVRRRYFRGVVVKVMLVALALFVFALYVLWQRGVFAQF